MRATVHPPLMTVKIWQMVATTTMMEMMGMMGMMEMMILATATRLKKLAATNSMDLKSRALVRKYITLQGVLRAAVLAGVRKCRVRSCDSPVPPPMAKVP
mmetsp:Transcript_15416/g.39810  ORF Transcript_15416/g.39810 Transcript_15416/m.39810 type:complete len:100 (+) Transcript_15416:2381-2680(+)